jgi:hypothetical protein
MSKSNGRGAFVFGGLYFERGPDGRLRPLGPTAPRPADAWICRRVRDYAPTPVPATGARGTCSKCGEAIVFNPARVAEVSPGTPKVCMQCAGIEPLPIES